MEKTKTNCIIINGGGIVDFFESNLELANPSQFMKGQDILKDLVTEAHKKDIKVLVRVDYRGVQKHRYDKKPHWFAAYADGSPKNSITSFAALTSIINNQDGNRDSNPNTLYSPCYSGYYANEHAVEHIKYLLNNYDIDGIWENALCFAMGPCYCRTCREKYKKDTGKEIPIADNYASSVFDEYRIWKAECADTHIKLLRDTVKSFGEEKAFCAEIFGMFHASLTFNSGIDLYNAKKHFDFLVSPAFLSAKQPNRVYDILSYAASSVRFMKSLDKDMQTVLLYGKNGQCWRYVTDPTVESKIWLWETVSVGGGFWNCMFNGQHPAATVDNRNAYMEGEVFSYMSDNEAILDGQVPVEDVGIYYSKPTRDAYGRDDENIDGYGVFIKGVERVLVDNHIQYSFIPDLDFSLEKLKNLKLLILPNAARMSDEHAQIIKEYVENGGGLIASYETSLYDEKGNKRSDFALKDLFGCSYTGIVKDTSFDCYQMINSEHHPILKGINNTSMLMNGGNTLLCDVNNKDEYTRVCSYIPIIPNQPPEYAWIKDTETEFPTVMAGKFGKGKVVYFSNQTDKLCHTNGHEDFINTFSNAIEWARNSELSMVTDAPDSVHINLTEHKEDSDMMVLSMINLTSSQRKPILKLLPVYDFSVVIPLNGKTLEEFKVLKQDGNIKVTSIKGEYGDSVKIEVSVLKEFASIYLKKSDK